MRPSDRVLCRALYEEAKIHGFSSSRPIVAQMEQAKIIAQAVSERTGIDLMKPEFKDDRYDFAFRRVVYNLQYATHNRELLGL